MLLFNALVRTEPLNLGLQNLATNTRNVILWYDIKHISISRTV